MGPRDIHWAHNRCAVLLHLIDATSSDALGDFRVIEHELTAYGGGLDTKPRIVVLNKCDALATGEADDLVTLLQGEGCRWPAPSRR